MLKAEGYDTAAFVSAFVLDERYGLSQGFDVYNFEASEEGRRSPQSLAIEREAHRVTSKAIEWLEDERKGGGDAPFFLWVHYYDPHAPYRSPLLKAIGADDLPLPAAYTAEIEFMDLHMGRLFDQLRKMGIDSRTLKVIVADHGEMLGEHGEIEHGGFIYESAMHVPFILSCDALFEGAYRVDDRIVSTVDITPTVLALLGIQPPKALDGVDLAAGTAEPDRAVYMETLYTRESMGAAPLYGLRRLNDKFILAPRSEYYDLREDPEEQVNLYGRKDSAIQELEGQLKDLVASRSDEPSAARSMSAEELAKLEALGYIGATEQVDRGALPDPKDQIPMLAELGEARRMMNEERYDEALEIAIGILDRTQCVNPAVLLVCETYAKMNRREAGVEVLEDYVRECSTVDVLIILSQQLFLLGRYQEMLRHLEAAELMDAREGSVPMLRGEYAAKIGDYDEALKQFKKGAGHRCATDRAGRAEEDRRSRAQDSVARAVRRVCFARNWYSQSRMSDSPSAGWPSSIYPRGRSN